VVHDKLEEEINAETRWKDRCHHRWKLRDRLGDGQGFREGRRAFTSRAAGRQNPKQQPPCSVRMRRPSRAMSPSRLISTASTTRFAVKWDASMSFSPMPAGRCWPPLGSLTEEHIDYHLDVNMKGVIWTVQKALPLMGPRGSIILNASIVASMGWANWSVYSASKAAVRNFARTWSSDLRGQGIRVNAISPGVIPTPAHENASASRDALKSFMEYAASITPLARTGTDEEVAKVVAFLASDDSSFIAASEIFVDGGIAQI